MPKDKHASAFYLFDFALGFETNNKQQRWQIFDEGSLIKGRSGK